MNVTNIEYVHKNKMKGKIKLNFLETGEKGRNCYDFFRCFILSNQSLYVGLFSKYEAKYYDEIKTTFEKGTNNVLVFRTISIINSIKLI